MAGFTIKRILRVPPESLWNFISDFEGAGIPGLEIIIEERGDPADHQVGAIRRIAMGSDFLREKLLRLDPEERSLTYQLLNQTPVRHFRGTVSIQPFGEHSLVSWRARFTPVFPWPADLVGAYIRRAINAELDELELTLPALSKAV